MAKKITKINYFNASKTFASDIAKFVNVNIVKKGNIDAKYADKLSEKNATLKNRETDLKAVLHGRELLTKESAVEIQRDIDIIKAKIDSLNNDKANDLASVNNYVLPRHFKAYKIALNTIKKDGQGSVDRAICELFKAYHIDCENTADYNYILKKCVVYGSSVKRYVATDGKNILLLNVDATVKNTFYYLFEQMVKAGTIKPKMLNGDAVEYYSRIKNKKAENKKSA